MFSSGGDKTESDSSESLSDHPNDEDDDAFPAGSKFIPKKKFKQLQINKLVKQFREEKEQKLKQQKSMKEGIIENQFKEVIEEDFMEGETLKIQDDVYNLTIAANLTKQVSPLSLIYAIKMCTMTFFIQFGVAYYFVYDYLSFDKFIIQLSQERGHR